MNLSVSTKDLKQDEGIVYVLQIDLEEKQLVKIGITSRVKVEERVCEILTSIWKKYRIFPRCYVKRFKKTDEIAKKEATLHDYFDECSYETEHKFSGCTEFFDVTLDAVVDVYDRLLNGEDLGDEYYKLEGKSADNPE